MSRLQNTIDEKFKKGVPDCQLHIYKANEPEELLDKFLTPQTGKTIKRERCKVIFYFFTYCVVRGDFEEATMWLGTGSDPCLGNLQKKEEGCPTFWCWYQKKICLLELDCVPKA